MHEQDRGYGPMGQLPEDMGSPIAHGSITGVHGTSLQEGIQFHCNSSSGRGSERRGPVWQTPEDRINQYTDAYIQDRVRESIALVDAKIQFTTDILNGEYNFSQNEQGGLLISRKKERRKEAPVGLTREAYLTHVTQRNERKGFSKYEARGEAWRVFAEQISSGRIYKIVAEEGGLPAEWKSAQNPKIIQGTQGFPTDLLLAQWIYEYMHENNFSEEKAQKQSYVDFANLILQGRLSQIESDSEEPPRWIIVSSRNQSDTQEYPSDAPPQITRAQFLTGLAIGTGVLVSGLGAEGILYLKSRFFPEGETKRTSPKKKKTQQKPLKIEGKPYTGKPQLQKDVVDTTGFEVYSVELTIPQGEVTILSLLNDPDTTQQHIEEVGGEFTTPNGPDSWILIHENFPPPQPLDGNSTQYFHERILIWQPASETRYALFLFRVKKDSPIIGAFDLRTADPSQVNRIIKKELPSLYPELNNVTPTVIIGLVPTCPGTGNLSPKKQQECIGS